MINIDSFIKSKQIKSMQKILRSKTDNWNTIAKWWLQKFDIKYNCDNFLAKCSDLRGLQMENFPKYYLELIKTWSKFLSIQSPINKNDILNQQLFGNIKIQYNKKPIFFANFGKSGIHTIKDIWDEETKNIKSDNFIYNTLKDKRNWISEWARLKLAIPKLFKDRLKNVHVDPEPPKNGYYIKNTFEFYDKQNKVVIPSEISLKLIQYSLNLDIVPNCQIKWNIQYNSELPWKKIWINLNKSMSSRKANQISWKIVHNIIYTEQKLFRIGKSNNGKCHFCKTENETLTHLFHSCNIIMVVWEHIFDALKTYNVLNNTVYIPLSEELIILGMYDYNKKYNVITNTIMNTVKWIIWKCRNIIKYQSKSFTSSQLIAYAKRELSSLIESMDKSLSSKKENFAAEIKLIINLIH